jgi:CRP/FNR family transcriptional regulator, cyclic AMP receptor protein
MATDLRTALHSIDLLCDLPSAHLDQLAGFAMIRTVRAGETIFCQGEPSPYCFGILRGEIQIQRVSRDRRQPPKVLSVLGPGALFGESSFFEESPRAAMASASKDGELIAILGMKLREWIRNEPTVGVPLLMGMLERTLGRLQQTSGDLSVIYTLGRLLGSQKPYAERLASSLDYLKNALEGVDDMILYQRSSYWDEFEPVWSTPDAGTAPGLPLASPLAEQAGAAAGHSGTTPAAIELKSAEQLQMLAKLQLPISKVATAALLPLMDQDQSARSLQGFLLMISREDPAAFSANTLLLLSSVGLQITEALARHRRQEDTLAQNRLNESRKSIHL